MKVLITGGTGFIGKKLVKRLTDEGHQAIILSRSERSTKNRLVSFLKWNGKEMPKGMAITDVVINLAGASIADEKWDDAYKFKIKESRMYATQACVDYINKSPRPPKVFISASAVGFYGSESDDVKEENSPSGGDFLAEVCYEWEEASKGTECRTVNPRIGVVLGKEGGAFPLMSMAYSLFLGGRFASGKQGFPWIHVDDVVKGIMHCIENEKVSGPVNFAGPELVDQQAFSGALAKALRRPDLFIVPKFMLELIFGERSVLFWGGQKVVPKKLVETGYTFKFPSLNETLAVLV